MKVLGIDPGYGIAGWSVVDGKGRLNAYGVIETSQKIVFPQRLVCLRRELGLILSEYKPTHAAIERLFFSRNTTTAIGVAQAMGVIILCLAEEGLTVDEYTPQQVKKALTGYARASKSQIQTMVMRYFSLETVPRPDDAADAIAVAACHCLRLNSGIKVPQ